MSWKVFESVTILEKRDFPILCLCYNLSCQTLYTHWILAYLGLNTSANKHPHFRTSRLNSTHSVLFWVQFVELYKTIVFWLFQCKRVRLSIGAVWHTSCSLNFQPHKPVWDSESSSSVMSLACSSAYVVLSFIQCWISDVLWGYLNGVKLQKSVITSDWQTDGEAELLIPTIYHIKKNKSRI